VEPGHRAQDQNCPRQRVRGGTLPSFSIRRQVTGCHSTQFCVPGTGYRTSKLIKATGGLCTALLRTMKLTKTQTIDRLYPVGFMFGCCLVSIVYFNYNTVPGIKALMKIISNFVFSSYSNCLYFASSFCAINSVLMSVLPDSRIRIRYFWIYPVPEIHVVAGRPEVDLNYSL
jgi:hypothetical protein